MNPHCKHCFSHDVIKKSYNRRKIYLENGISVIIKVKRYLCKKCRKYSQVRLNGIYEDFCNFSIKMKNKAVELRKRVWDSLRNLSWTFNVFNGINMSYETMLCVRISKCSCESLSIKLDRRTVNLSILVGSGIGPATCAPLRSAVSTIRFAD